MAKYTKQKRTKLKEQTSVRGADFNIPFSVIHRANKKNQYIHKRLNVINKFDLTDIEHHIQLII